MRPQSDRPSRVSTNSGRPSRVSAIITANPRLKDDSTFQNSEDISNVEPPTSPIEISTNVQYDDSVIKNELIPKL